MSNKEETRSVKGKIILITGASRGIGYALANRLAKDGANLILVSRKQEDIDAAVNKLKKETQNNTIAGFACDLASLSSINSLFKTISSKYTHLDVVVNNASTMIGFKLDPLTVSDELEEQQFRINLDAYHFVTKRALPLLFKAPDGFERTVVFVTSGAGWVTEPAGPFAMLGYCATKAGENGLMVALDQLYVKDSEEAKKIRGDNKLHRVVSVHPGIVSTGLGRETLFGGKYNADELAKVMAKVPGVISPDDGCDTIYWLITAKKVESGKHYYNRKIHSF